MRTAEEQRAAARARYYKNRAHILAMKKKQYVENPEKFLNRKKEEYVRNGVAIKARVKKHRANNLDQCRAADREYYAKNSVRLAGEARKYRAENAPAIKIARTAYRKRKYQNDPYFRLTQNLRRRLLQAVKRQSATKSARTVELIGGPAQTVRLHLEKQFQPGMTWGNHSPTGWHIDHIKPCDKFDLTKPEEQRACFHYTNLQPLWEPDNKAKSNKY